MSRTIEERVYRLTRRRGGYNYPPGGIACHDFQRAVERELLVPVLSAIAKAIR